MSLFIIKFAIRTASGWSVFIGRKAEQITFLIVSWNGIYILHNESYLFLPIHISITSTKLTVYKMKHSWFHDTPLILILNMQWERLHVKERLYTVYFPQIYYLIHQRIKGKLFTLFLIEISIFFIPILKCFHKLLF